MIGWATPGGATPGGTSTADIFPCSPPWYVDDASEYSCIEGWSRDCNNNSISNSGIQGRTHRPIIRSGMQPKSSSCKSYVNDYSFDYRQYQHNHSTQYL